MMFTSPQDGHVTFCPMTGLGTSIGFSQRSQVMTGIGRSRWLPVLFGGALFSFRHKGGRAVKSKGRGGGRYAWARMRILMVNWARVIDGAALGGGVNVYAQQLALEMAGRGHEVMWLNSGQRYIGWEGGKGGCRVRRFEDWRGVRQFEVFNSPVVSPGPCQAVEPMVEVSAPALEAEVARFCGLVEPDIVHFHNIEGFSAGCVA